MSGHLIEHLAFVGNGFGQDVIKRGNAVGSDHQHLVAEKIYIADLAAVKSGLTGERKVGFPECLRHWCCIKMF